MGWTSIGIRAWMKKQQYISTWNNRGYLLTHALTSTSTSATPWKILIWMLIIRSDYYFALVIAKAYGSWGSAGSCWPHELCYLGWLLTPQFEIPMHDRFRHGNSNENKWNLMLCLCRGIANSSLHSTVISQSQIRQGQLCTLTWIWWGIYKLYTKTWNQPSSWQCARLLMSYIFF